MQAHSCVTAQEMGSLDLLQLHEPDPSYTLSNLHEVVSIYDLYALPFKF